MKKPLRVLETGGIESSKRKRLKIQKGNETAFLGVAKSTGKRKGFG